MSVYFVSAGLAHAEEINICLSTCLCVSGGQVLAEELSKCLSVYLFVCQWWTSSC